MAIPLACVWRLLLGSIILNTTLVGCSLFEAEKIPLEGNRIPVKTHQEAVSPSAHVHTPNPADTTLPSLSLSLKHENAASESPAEDADCWLQSFRVASHAGGNLKLPDTVKPVWSYDTNRDPGYVAVPPIVTRKHILLYNRGTVHCLDLRGKVIWKTLLLAREDLSQFGGGLAGDGKGRLYITTPCCRLFCIQEETGEVVWEAPTAAPVRGAPTLYGEYVCCLNMNNQVELFMAKTGELGMRHSGLVEEARMLGGASPAVAEHILIMGHSSGEVTALSLLTGEVLWTRSGHTQTRSFSSPHALSPFNTSPIIHQGAVYIFTGPKQLSCLDLQTGDTLWTCPISSPQTPWVVGNALFCLTDQSHLVAIHTGTGNIVWSRALSSKPAPQGGEIGPIVAHQNLYVANSEGQILVLDPLCQGKLVKMYASQGIISAPLVIAQGKLLVFLNSGCLVVWEGAP